MLISVFCMGALIPKLAAAQNKASRNLVIPKTKASSDTVLSKDDAIYLTRSIFSAVQSALSQTDFNVVRVNQLLANVREQGKTVRDCQVEGGCELGTLKLMGADFVLNSQLVKTTRGVTIRLELADTGRAQGPRRVLLSQELTSVSDTKQLAEILPGGLEPFTQMLTKLDARARGLGIRDETLNLAEIKLLERERTQPKRTVVQIEVREPGSRVYIASTKTPTKKTLLCVVTEGWCSRAIPNGRYKVTVEANMFDSWQSILKVPEQDTLTAEQAPRFGRLKLIDVPAGVTVRLNGKALGQAPLSRLKRRIPLGKQHLELSSPCYEPWQRTIRVRKGKTIEVVSELATKTQTLKVSATTKNGRPIEANLKLNGKRLGSSEDQHQLPICEEIDGQRVQTPSRYTLDIEREYHVPVTRRFKLNTNGDTKTFRVTLAKVGKLKVTCQKPADIYVDGKIAGRSKLEQRMLPGSYRVLCGDPEMPRVKTNYERQVTVKSGETTQVVLKTALFGGLKVKCPGQVQLRCRSRTCRGVRASNDLSRVIPGRYRVKCVVAHGTPDSKTVRVRAGQTTSLRLSPDLYVGTPPTFGMGLFGVLPPNFIETVHMRDPDGRHFGLTQIPLFGPFGGDQGFKPSNYSSVTWNIGLPFFFQNGLPTNLKRDLDIGMGLATDVGLKLRFARSGPLARSPLEASAGFKVALFLPEEEQCDYGSSDDCGEYNNESADFLHARLRILQHLRSKWFGVHAGVELSSLRMSISDKLVDFPMKPANSSATMFGGGVEFGNKFKFIVRFFTDGKDARSFSAFWTLADWQPLTTKGAEK